MNRVSQQSNRLKAVKSLRLDQLVRGGSLYGLPAEMKKPSLNPHRKVPNTTANGQQNSRSSTRRKTSADKQTQAYQSLYCLNHNLYKGVRGVGYIAKATSVDRNIPTYDENRLAPGLWSACTLWITHLLELSGPASELVCEQLQEFLTNKFILWIEFVTAHGQYMSLKSFLHWLKEKSAQFPLKIHFDGVEVANIMDTLSACLEFMGRAEEAVEACRDRVEILRHICEKSSAFEHRTKFGRALCALSRALSIQNQFEDALNASREAVEVQRKLYNECSMTETRVDIANSLHHQSFSLTHLGRHEEALEAIQETNTTFKELAPLDPAKYNTLFVESISTLSTKLSNLEHMEESLEMIRAAVAMRRQLVTDNPAEHTPGLAQGLHNLGVTLSDMEYHQEALRSKKEAVDIYRELAANRPTAFLDKVAHTLTSLSWEYSLCGQDDEAVIASKESVALYRTLVAKNPDQHTLGLHCSLERLADAYFDAGARGNARAARLELEAILKGTRPAEQ